MQNLLARLFCGIKCFLLFTLLLLVSSCNGTPKPLTDAELAQVIPDDILKYTLSGVGKSMDVESVEISRRQTNEKEDIIDAIINMSDQYVHRTAFYTLIINYYDEGGWMVDDWVSYQDTETYPLKAPSENEAKSEASGLFNNMIFNSLSDDNVQDGYCVYLFDVKDERTNCTILGQVDVHYTFSGTDDCEWNANINSNVSTDWSKIKTKWSSRFDYINPNGQSLDAQYEESLLPEDQQYMYITVEITDVSDSSITLNGTMTRYLTGYERWDDTEFNYHFDNPYSREVVYGFAQKGKNEEEKVYLDCGKILPSGIYDVFAPYHLSLLFVPDGAYLMIGDSGHMDPVELTYSEVE